MTRGVVSAILGGFGTKWGRINIKGSERECFFNRSSLLKAEDFEDLAYGREVEFDEEPDNNLGSRAVRLTIVRAPGSLAQGASDAVGT
jgi:cold shock CspA family protein